MKLHFFKEAALDYFKANVKSNISHYSDPDNSWVYEQYEDPFEEIEIDCEPFDLYIDSENPTKMDLENIKILYTALKSLTNSQACDERLWTGLAHSDFYNYTQARWSNSREKDNMKKENYILTRYFYAQDSKSKFRHTLAKLWWTGKMIYDNNNLQDPLHFADTLGRKDMATRMNDVFTSNFSRNIHLLRPFLNVIDYYDLSGKIVDQNYFRSLVQYLNIVGGLYLVDFLEEDRIETMLKDRVVYYDKYGSDVVKDIKKKRVNIHSKLRVFSKNRNNKFNITIDEDNLIYFLNKKVNDMIEYKNDELTILLIY